MSHCFPCSGSGWYVSSSYISASVEVPHLTGPFGSSGEACLYADCLIMSATMDDPRISFINVFEHTTSKQEDAQRFFDSLAYDVWNDEYAEHFLELVNNDSGSAVVSLLSESYIIRGEIESADPCDVEGCNLLRQQRNNKLSEAVVMFQAIFEL